MILVQHAGDDYMLAVPSLVALDTTSTGNIDLTYLVDNQLLGYTNYSGIPESIGGSGEAAA